MEHRLRPEEFCRIFARSIEEWDEELTQGLRMAPMCRPSVLHEHEPWAGTPCGRHVEDHAPPWGDRRTPHLRRDMPFNGGTQSHCGYNGGDA